MIIRNARIKNVGKSDSCMVCKIRIIFKRARSRWWCVLYGVDAAAAAVAVAVAVGGAEGGGNGFVLLIIGVHK